MNQKECISINFRKELGIFDYHYRYPAIGEGTKYNGPVEKVRQLRTNILQYGPYLKTKANQYQGITI